MLRAVAWLAARDTHACVWENKDTWLEMARLSPFVPFGLVLAFQPWLWPFWPMFGLSDTLTWLFAMKMSFVFSHRAVNMIYKRVWRNCPISSCGAKYLVRLANHLADFHQLEHIQRRQYLQERNYNLKLKWSFTKVKRIIPEKITIAIQCRHKKRCRNCQDHGEMKPLLKQKLKEQLQRTRQNERNKESRTLGLEAIGELCRHGRIISYSSK